MSYAKDQIVQIRGEEPRATGKTDEWLVLDVIDPEGEVRYDCINLVDAEERKFRGGEIELHPEPPCCTTDATGAKGNRRWTQVVRLLRQQLTELNASLPEVQPTGNAPNHEHVHIVTPNNSKPSRIFKTLKGALAYRDANGHGPITSRRLYPDLT